MSEKMQGKWNDQQIKYIQFLARGCRNKKGERKTEEQFSQAIGVNFSTLWRWKQIPGFKMAVVEEAVNAHIKDVPMLIEGQIAVARGHKKIKVKTFDKHGKEKVVTLEPNTNAFNAVMKLMGWSERVDTRIEGELKTEHSGNIGVNLSTKSDSELEEIIKKGAIGV